MFIADCQGAVRSDQIRWITHAAGVDRFGPNAPARRIRSIHRFHLLFPLMSIPDHAGSVSHPPMPGPVSEPPSNGASGSAPERAIAARGICKTYAATKRAPAKTALHGIDLEIPRGSIFGLLGPNGAGKSTFINIMSGMVRKSAGQMSLWGMDIDLHPRAARAAIGVVPQELNMDPFFTPRETLELQAGFYGVPKAERRTAELLRIMGLADKADAYVRQLSGGMKRRLMIGKAMVHEPPILVLDEPSAGVDVELRRQLWAMIRRLNAEGVTIVLTTHYLEEAQELCDRIAIIDNGAVTANESTAQLLKRLDHKTLIIEPTAKLAMVPAALADLAPTLTAEGTLVFTWRQGEIRVEDLLDRIRSAGIAIKDLKTQEPDLEDVFVALTGQK